MDDVHPQKWLQIFIFSAKNIQSENKYGCDEAGTNGLWKIVGVCYQ